MRGFFGMPVVLLGLATSPFSTRLPAASAAGQQAAQGSTAELPRVTLDTRMLAVTGRSIVVGPSGDLQAALDRARPGDEIVLQAGATYSGSFELPVKPGASRMPGTGPVILIRSSALGSLPEGRRVGPTQAKFMARLMVTRNEAHVFGTAAGTAGWRLAGLEITAAPTVTTLQRLVRLGDGNPTQNTVASVPMNIIVDRSFIHVGPTAEVKHCIDLHSGASAVIDSDIEGCKSRDTDAQAILGYNGPGPYKIANNYLEASGENVMFGGGNPAALALMPSDIEVRHNYFAKPLAWKKGEPEYDGSTWVMKNLFELKLAQRVLIEGNVFEHSWVNAQAGFALLLKSENTWNFVTTDVTVRNNIVRGAAGGVNVAGIAAAITRVTVTNNLFLDVGSARWGESAALLQAINAADLSFTHNTGFTTSAFLALVTGPIPRLAFTSNIVSHGIYGAKAPGQPIGTPSLAAAAPGALFAGNVLIGAAAPYDYPATTYLCGRIEAVGFADVRAENYGLGPASPYLKRGSDGADPGLNFAALSAAVTGAKP